MLNTGLALSAALVSLITITVGIFQMPWRCFMLNIIAEAPSDKDSQYDSIDQYNLNTDLLIGSITDFMLVDLNDLEYGYIRK